MNKDLLTYLCPRSILYFIVKSGIFICFISFACFALCSSSAFPFDGPLQARNQFPPFLIANPPHLEAASYGNSFSASLSHSSTFMIRNSTVWSVNIDAETTELNLRYRKIIKDFIELGIDLPLLGFNSGFMDDFLKNYHDAFGFPDYGRAARPLNEFLYEIRRNGTLIVKGGNGQTGIGDIRLSAKKAILNSDPVVSLKVDVELPSGEASKGFGNGSLDAGISVLIDKKLSEKLMAYLNFGMVFPGNLKGHEKLGLRDFFHGGACIEAALWEHTSLLGQIYMQNSTFPKTGIPTMDRISVILSIGTRFHKGNNGFEISFSEDPNTSGAPDFTMNISFKREF